MRTIRTGVFETNSSSCHSIAIRGKKEDLEKPNQFKEFFLTKDRKIKLEPSEYGWGGEPLTMQYEKLQYLITMVIETELNKKGGYHRFKKKEPVEEIVKRTKGFKMLNDWAVEHGFGGIELIMPEAELEKVSYRPPEEDFDKNAISLDRREEEDDYKWQLRTSYYIDHQSCCYKSLAHFLKSNKITLDRFIRDWQVEMLIRNDNCDYEEEDND